MSDVPRLDDTAVRWRGAPGDGPLVVLLHGYGSDEGDLFAIAEQLPDAYAYAAVRAPMTPPWPTPGYSWYPLEGEGARDTTATTRAAEGLLAWLDGVDQRGQTGLLGFSQGGAVSLQALRIAPERFGFVLNLSGYATPGELPGDAVLAERRPPVFWGRGTADAVIPEALVAHTTDWLPGHSDLVGRIYPGLRHAVSPQEIDDVRTFLDKQLENPVAGG